MPSVGDEWIISNSIFQAICKRGNVYLNIWVLFLIPVSRRVVLLCLWKVSKNLPSSTYAGIIFSTRVGVCGPLLSVMVPQKYIRSPYAGIIFNTRG